MVNASISSSRILFEQYYRGLGPGEDPDRVRLIVALESSGLRLIVSLVDNKIWVDSILDPGCQIVTMSKEVCHELALAYDPSIKIYMQSANGMVNESLGLHQEKYLESRAS